MAHHKLYLHGVPTGHNVVGGNELTDIFKDFYDSSTLSDIDAVLQIEVWHGRTIYTYLRKKNVSGNGHRPGSYFGITVSFEGKYCTNVARLYELLDTIYNGVCIGTVLTRENNGERFLVERIDQAEYQGVGIYEAIDTIFNNNFDISTLAPLNGFSDSKGESDFNLDEIDSPLFFHVQRNRKINVSPQFPVTREATEELASQLRRSQQKCAELTGNIASLEATKAALSSENTRLHRHAEAQLAEERAKAADAERRCQLLTGKVEKYRAENARLEEGYGKLTAELAHVRAEAARNAQRNATPDADPTPVINDDSDSQPSSKGFNSLRIPQNVLLIVIAVLILLTLFFGIRSCVKSSQLEDYKKGNVPEQTEDSNESANSGVTEAYGNDFTVPRTDEFGYGNIVGDGNDVTITGDGKVVYTDSETYENSGSYDPYADVNWDNYYIDVNFTSKFEPGVKYLVTIRKKNSVHNDNIPVSLPFNTADMRVSNPGASLSPQGELMADESLVGNSFRLTFTPRENVYLTKTITVTR